MLEKKVEMIKTKKMPHGKKTFVTITNEDIYREIQEVKDLLQKTQTNNRINRVVLGLYGVAISYLAYKGLV